MKARQRCVSAMWMRFIGYFLYGFLGYEGEGVRGENERKMPEFNARKYELKKILPPDQNT